MFLREALPRSFSLLICFAMRDFPEFKHMDSCARALVSRRRLQMGYPFNQDTDFADYYRWLVDTGLADTTLINVGDPYKKDWDMLNTDEFERSCIDFFAKHFGFGEDRWGVISNGGTDGNMHGLYFGRKSLQARVPDKPCVLYVSEEAHYSMRKLGDILNMPTCTVAALEDGRMDVDDFARKLDPSKPALVGIAIGGTFKAAIDDQDAIDSVLKSSGVPAYYRHLDVALFGGYLPFLDDEKARGIVSAKLRGFDSIAVSGHKFLSLNEPVGVFVCRRRVLEDLHSIPVPYLNGVIPTISCSRSGFDALKLYWRICSTGEEGFKKEAAHTLKMAELLHGKLLAAGVEAWRNPYSTTVFFRRPKDSLIHKYCMACEGCRYLGELSHVVVMQYFDEELIDMLVGDLSGR